MKKSIIILNIISLGYLGYAVAQRPMPFFPIELEIKCIYSPVATAMANIPQVGDNRLFSVGASYGNSTNKNAFALGISGTEKTNTFVYKASVGADTEKKVGAGLGFNVNFGDNKTEDTSGTDLIKGIMDNNDKINGNNRVLLDQINEIKDELDNKKCVAFEEKLYVIDQYINDKYTLTNTQTEKLSQIVNEINEKYPDRIIDIVGHTDTNHNERYNLDLGLNRANNIVSKMKELGLKNPQNIRKVSSFGYNNKVDSKSLSSNRRVEIYIK